MIILYDDTLTSINHSELVMLTQELGIELQSRRCHVNNNSVDLKEIGYLSDILKTKVLLVTDKAIKSDEMVTGLSAYNGLVDGINGNVGMVSINSQNLEKWAYISLHEILHLKGAKHCNGEGCVMAFHLCGGHFKYCLECQSRCNPLHVCSQCRGAVND
jgi:predicted Zn-dependent protease